MGQATTSNPTLLAALDTAAKEARSAAVFASVSQSPGRVVCTPTDCPEEAFYALEATGDECWVSLATPHRYLSQSIEADLVNTGDHLSDLLADELIELGYAGPAPAVEHFRSADKLFTFRSRIPAPVSAERARVFLLAFEACFRPLGDMSAGAGEG